MTQLLHLYFDICLLRRGPQDVPASVWLLRATLVCYLALGVLLLIVAGDSPWVSMAEAVIDFALLTGITWAALSWHRLQARFAQTLTALLGAGVVMYLINLPVVQWLGATTIDGRADPLPVLVWYALLVWGLTVVGHVMRHALQSGFAVGMLIAVGYFISELVLFGLLF